MAVKGERSLVTEVFLEELRLIAKVVEKSLTRHEIPFMQERLTRRQQRARLEKMTIEEFLGLAAQAVQSGQGLGPLQEMIDEFKPRE